MRRSNAAILIVSIGVIAAWLLNREAAIDVAAPQRQESPSDAPVRLTSSGRTTVAEPVRRSPNDSVSPLEGELLTDGRPSEDLEGDEDQPDVLTILGFNGFFDVEPVDPDWAPQMEQTLDNTIRTMGSPVRDVVVRCLTNQCRMVLLYQPSYFFIEGNEARSATQTALMEDLNTMLQPIYQASDRLDKMGGSPQVQVSREAPVGTGFEAPAGTIFAEHDAGITAGVFIVYGANSEKLGNTSSLFGPRN